MSNIEVGTAFVRILPDTKGFSAALIAEMKVAQAAATKSLVGSSSASTAMAGALAGTTVAGKQASASLNGVHAGSKKAAQGMLSASSEANAARGALIGLARVTPVAVFGLGVIGTAAIAAGLAIKGSVNAAAQLEQQLNIFQSVTGATGAEMAAVSAQA